MTEFHVTYRGTVYPWHCDHIGHMNVMWYSGKFDDNWKEPGAVKEKYLEDALEAILTGAQVRVPETHSIGCTIKWK